VAGVRRWRRTAADDGLGRGGVAGSGQRVTESVGDGGRWRRPVAGRQLRTTALDEAGPTGFGIEQPVKERKRRPDVSGGEKKAQVATCWDNLALIPC
jgi:hypothetical protein